MSALPNILWPENGLIPVVIQDDTSDTVLMLGFMNEEALRVTLETHEVHFWSRSRQALWHKGSSSGHVQSVRSMAVNCDLNSLLIRVEQIGAVCHDGYATCYYRDVLEDGTLATNQDPMFDPRDIYGDGMGLHRITQLWWGAYEWLRDHDLTEVSSTSRLLRESRIDVVGRIADELGELAGVLDGTHRHSTQADDTLLESSQCLYWLAVSAIKSGVTFDALRPDRAIDVRHSQTKPITMVRLLRSEAATLRELESNRLPYLFHLVAEAAVSMGVDPRTIIESDLAALRSRPYLTEYFASH